MFRGRPHFITDTFTRYRVPRADVVPLEKTGDEAEEFECVMKRAETCKVGALRDVGLNFYVSYAKGKRLRFKRIQACTGPPALDNAIPMLNATMRAACELHAGQACLTSPPDQQRRLIPRMAEEHQTATGHRCYARKDTARRVYVLGKPLPIVVDMARWRCHTCVPRRDFTVTTDDLQRTYQAIVIPRCGKDRRRAVYVTPAIVEQVVRDLYETFNLKETRRRLFNFYVSLVSMPHAGLAGPQSLCEVCDAVPKRQELQAMLRRALVNFLEARVAVLRRRQFLYNGQGIRHDGNYGLAKRIITDKRRGRRPFTVVLGFCGVDGSLLEPVVARETEDWPDIKSALAPLLCGLKKARTEAGLAGDYSVPVFHATDSYRKHRQMLNDLYHEIWPEHAVRTSAGTPKGDVSHAAVQPWAGASGLCSVTGEPQHDIISIRRLISPSMNDRKDLLFDHIDLIQRLSSAEAADQPTPPETPPELPPGSGGSGLLRMAVTLPGDAFTSQVRKRPRASADVRAFLRHPSVRASPTWGRLFRASPPRGTIARIARRLGKVELPPSCQARRWESRQQFIDEVGRIKSWYENCKRVSRRRMGIHRRRGLLPRVYGKNCALTPRVLAHYRRLLAPTRLEGLWRWREVAEALHAGGIQMQTGTAAVERLWSGLQAMFQPTITRMTPQWFSVLSMMAFSRYKYRHFHRRRNPAWTDNDSLLAERLDDIRSCLFPETSESPDPPSSTRCP